MANKKEDSKTSVQTEVLDNNDVAQKKKCFVITPIGDDNSEIRRHIDGVIKECIRPVLDDFNFEVYVSHKISTPGSINNQILTHIYNDELVIANLTNLNPNVMYELAFRHSIRKHVIVIKSKNDGCSLPFDVKDDRTIFYTDDISGTGELKEQLRNFLNEINYEHEADNPIVRAVHDLKLLESVEKDMNMNLNESQQGALNYIINRLDTIESRLALSLNSRKIIENFSDLKLENIYPLKKSLHNKINDPSNSVTNLVTFFDNENS